MSQRGVVRGVALAAVLVVSGCGGGSDEPEPVDLSGSASSAVRASVDEMVFSGVQGATTIASQTVTLRNEQRSAQTVVSVAVTGSSAEDFTVVTPVTDAVIAPGADLDIEVRFTPGKELLGPVDAELTALLKGAPTLRLGLHGLATKGEQGAKEPSLASVLTALGHPVDTGSTDLIIGIKDPIEGEEVGAPLFRAVEGQPVTLSPLARYSPAGPLPYGWYTPAAGGAPTLHPVGSLAGDQEQTLLPEHTGPSVLDAVGTAPFGLYVRSNASGRDTFTQDALNTGPSKHAARVYPLHDREGALVPNGYVVAFEDASNGDYQDFVYALEGVTIVG